MPQLDISTFSSQLFWLIIAFGMLYFVVARSILPTIHGVLENRRRQLSVDLDRAEKLRREAEVLRQDYEHLLAKAHHDASDVVHKAMQEATVKAAERNARLDDTLERQVAESEARLHALREEAREKLEPVVVGITQAMVNRFLDKKLDDSAVRKAIAERTPS